MTQLPSKYRDHVPHALAIYVARDGPIVVENHTDRTAPQTGPEFRQLPLSFKSGPAARASTEKSAYFSACRLPGLMTLMPALRIAQRLPCRSAFSRVSDWPRQLQTLYGLRPHGHQHRQTGAPADIGGPDRLIHPASSALAHNGTLPGTGSWRSGTNGDCSVPVFAPDVDDLVAYVGCHWGAHWIHPRQPKVI